ncbi:hypothetical protein ACLB1O_28615 [Escherichia coli]
MRGRTGFESADYPQGRWLREAWEVAQSVPTKAVVEAGFKGVEIREELTRRRIAAVASWKEQRCPKPEWSWAFCRMRRKRLIRLHVNDSCRPDKTRKRRIRR